MLTINSLVYEPLAKAKLKGDSSPNQILFTGFMIWQKYLLSQNRKGLLDDYTLFKLLPCSPRALNTITWDKFKDFIPKKRYSCFYSVCPNCYYDKVRNNLTRFTAHTILTDGFPFNVVQDIFEWSVPFSDINLAEELVDSVIRPGRRRIMSDLKKDRIEHMIMSRIKVFDDTIFYFNTIIFCFLKGDQKANLRSLKNLPGTVKKTRGRKDRCGSVFNKFLTYPVSYLTLDWPCLEKIDRAHKMLYDCFRRPRKEKDM